jgi:hypothetical protein
VVASCRGSAARRTGSTRTDWCRSALAVPAGQQANGLRRRSAAVDLGRQRARPGVIPYFSNSVAARSVPVRAGAAAPVAAICARQPDV